ncbi:hypothetical protein ASE86_02610 [Sphingomonas sp. Leaf33]|uniref:hypothetical protein n=1 Tax=Sphingomonas sp. Leaf33 TaxID=1736215 RepID=UPI0006FDACA6|nr:hypothetical protein [Sphingomonas sp. Leaf33]KQN25168.1 hypothetical protein ASE86_02610 [Sphingomonas sp. Leaf33]
MDTGGGFWSILTIVGPLVLIAVLAWVVLGNRRSKAAEQRTEEATRANYERQERADRSHESHH